MVGIYKISSPSGKIYIGQSWDISQRFCRYRYKKHWRKQPVLAASFIKHGIESHSFEIVTLLPGDVSQGVLDAYECIYIDAYRNSGHVMMNVRDGGSRGKHRETSKTKIRNTLKGIKRPKEVADKISKIGREFFKSEKGAAACVNGGKSHKGKITGTVTKNRMRMAQPKRTAINVHNTKGEFIGHFESQHEASKSLNIWQANISSAIRNNKPFKDYVFSMAA